MAMNESAGAVRDDETEAEYLERKTREYFAMRERFSYKTHFNYRRSR
jgi:hypothetical protein